MQILHWLFKLIHDQEREYSSDYPTQREAKNDQEDKEANIILYKHGVNRNSRRSEGRKSLRSFAFICRKDIEQACFYNTLKLKRLGSTKRRHNFVNSMKMKKQDLARRLGISTNKTDSTTSTNAGNKVLPISDAPSTQSNSSEESSDCEKKDGNGDKARRMSRMKELLRWAAAAKEEKGGKFIGRKVLHFRNRGMLKAAPDDQDELSIESPKTSFRWDVESCSTISSAYSEPTLTSFRNEKMVMNERTSSSIDVSTCRKGNWITTDSEFVVLEL